MARQVRRQLNEILKCGASQSDHFAESGAPDSDVPEFQKPYDGLSGRRAVSGADYFVLRLLDCNGGLAVREVAK